MLKNCTISFFSIIVVIFIQSNAFAENEIVSIQSFYHEYFEKPERLFDIDVYQKKDIVTGVDVDKLLDHYIDDYERFSISMLPCLNDMMFRWSVKPDPNDPETRYFWGKKRDTLEYRRLLKMHIGVYKSHEEAVKRGVLANDFIQIPIDCTLIGNHYALNKIDECHAALRSHMHVVDNVFISFSASPDGWCDEEAILEGIISDIKNGTNGVTRGTVLELPIIDTSKIPSEITLNKEEGIEFTLPYSDPNGLPCAPYISCNAFDSDREKKQGYNFQLDWDCDTGTCTIKNEQNYGERTAIANICGAVCNKRCVFSDPFYKKSVIVHFVNPSDEPEVELVYPDR